MFDLNSIPKSETDLFLNKSGYDLIEEYFDFFNFVNFAPLSVILDLATGTGRATSLLARLGYSVITGDYNPNLKSDSQLRIGENYLSKIKFVRLNLENIPIRDNSIENIVCIETLHELENPFAYLDEIIRIHTTNGKLLIADFNLLGFKMMDKLYIKRYNKLHTRGKIISTELEKILVAQYFEVKKITTKLNIGFLAIGKKNGR